MSLISHYETVELISISSRLVIATVLFAAGIMKVVRPPNLQPLLTSLGAIKLASHKFMIGVLITVEVGAGLWIFTGWRTPYSLIAVILMFSVFFLIQTVAIKRGYKGGCVCFGADENGKIGITQRARNIAFLFLSVFSLVGNPKTDANLNFPWTLPPIVFGLAGIMLVTGTAIYLISLQVESLVRQPSS